MARKEQIYSLFPHSWCTDNSSRELYSDEVSRLIAVKPSQLQLDFMEMEYYNFIHFGVNTFYGREWGDGTEDIRRFNPKKLDTDQWCSVLKDTGSKGIIITAKHHDGFCLFDTKYTDHNVMYSPFKKDIVKLLSESCRKYGMKLGIYLSPWDRHESTYGTEKYNDYFVSQLKELCTNYGEIFTFWFDGACGEGKNGKKQIYDWKRYYSVIRELQPGAVISICGPDVRWIGNEAGKVRKSEWSVIPAEKDANSKIMENSQQSESGVKKLMSISERDEDLGSREVLRNFDNLVFKPAEADVSANIGWFFTKNIFKRTSKRRTAEKLAQIYFSSVGGNASLLLNVPPNKKGLIDKSNVAQLRKFTELINAPFKKEAKNYTAELVAEEPQKAPEALFEKGEGYLLRTGEKGVRLCFESAVDISAVTLRENLAFSQRVEEFEVYTALNGGDFNCVYKGTVIGSKRIVVFDRPVKADELVIIPTSSRSDPVLRDIRVYIN